MSNPLEPVWNWYEIALDSMRVTSRILEKNIKGAVTQKHIFHSLTSVEGKQRITDASRELDKLVVVAMVAVFERALREHIVDRVLPSLAGDDAFSRAIQKQVQDDIEFWHLSSRLIDEVFKIRVDATLCGMVKQIINYRNDVAHGHSEEIEEKAQPAYASPATVYQRLTNFLHEGGIIKP